MSYEISTSMYVPFITFGSHDYEELSFLRRVSHFLDCTECEGGAKLLYDVSSFIRT